LAAEIGAPAQKPGAKAFAPVDVRTVLSKFPSRLVSNQIESDASSSTNSLPTVPEI
jgi:hypothetical protein